MDDSVKYFKKLIEAVERLEKAGTLADMVNDLEECKPEWRELVNVPSPYAGATYKQITDHCRYQIADAIYQIQRQQGRLKYYTEYAQKFYEDLTKDEEALPFLNPNLQQFIEGYEADHRPDHET